MFLGVLVTATSAVAQTTTTTTTTTTTGSSNSTGITRDQLGEALRATVDGQPVGVELLGNVSYVEGSGPIFGFVTFTFADGSTLAVAVPGPGDRVFTGSRQAGLGTTVASTFDLTIVGAS